MLDTSGGSVQLSENCTQNIAAAPQAKSRCDGGWSWSADFHLEKPGEIAKGISVLCYNSISVAFCHLNYLNSRYFASTSQWYSSILCTIHVLPASICELLLCLDLISHFLYCIFYQSAIITSVPFPRWSLHGTISPDLSLHITTCLKDVGFSAPYTPAKWPKYQWPIAVPSLQLLQWSARGWGAVRKENHCCQWNGMECESESEWKSNHSLTSTT